MKEQLDEFCDHIDLAQINGLISAAGVDAAREILAAFGRSTDELLDSLSAQIHDNALDLAAKTAHAIKGSSANLGAARLAETANRLELACKAGDASEAVLAKNAAREDFVAVKRILDDHLRQSA